MKTEQNRPLLLRCEALLFALLVTCAENGVTYLVTAAMHTLSSIALPSVFRIFNLPSLRIRMVVSPSLCWAKRDLSLTSAQPLWVKNALTRPPTHPQPSPLGVSDTLSQLLPSGAPASLM